MFVDVLRTANRDVFASVFTTETAENRIHTYRLVPTHWIHQATGIGTKRKYGAD
jgi:hypothetical protein